MAEPPRRPEPLRCDFCGEAVSSVRRVALDVGYDRLKPHREQYACERCSERKDRERRGLDRR
jgi:hypothetical protein